MTNQDLFDRARAVLPGGVNSPVRAFLSVGGTPYFVARAAGSKVWDSEGNEYLDYVQSYGASILGHADPAVVAAVTAAAADGTTYGAPTEREVQLAELVCEWVPGVDMIRMTSSGTEATMSAIRLARGATGRKTVVKFAGCYHGHVDSLLVAGGSGVANQGLVGSAGVTESAVADTIVAPYNTVPTLDEDVAVLAVEAVAANMGVVAPEPGFLQALRQECDRVGALLFFDEVITGFRLGQGGATAWSGVRPDLWAFGKVIGGGLPVGAFGASAEIMANVAPLGPVYQGGTLSGNPLATAAGLAALGQLAPERFAALEATAGSLATGLAKAISGAGLAVQVPRVGPLLSIFFADAPVRHYDDAKVAADNGLYPAFFHGMLKRGIALAPGPYEALFPSLAHVPADIDRTIEAAADVAAEMAAAA
ncbi:MAG: aminotransferase class III-fold pyridoxal phosphate-dependent enzyme [Actinomycetia bacterium]|nr:aminotransferase class III-fold pyridoxal phosphate-dependent enzyme [Actinomycetes bacterium]MCP4227183.1 aminotransferase class III-fold pyridoxal phosphate-dependent enzyme [Actinomycetes bacterium]MCP5030312.1 aminotransferase class III-fold pyridoxal phosphate-dependent enzyme [Actinomycetes bacterium]